ncbi:MAG TPA: MoxR family ATPase [Candidatus Saccharimonadales bacterium]|nr:MoxR family ATPase [Candidatus Saccharimonadales bacterium]
MSAAETSTNGIDLTVLPTDLAANDISPDMMTGYAINFYNDSMRDLNAHLIKGEEAAKTALLAGLVLGRNVLLVGEPAGGKSTLANNFHHLIEDIDSEDIALIPGEHDITAKEMVGGVVTQKIRDDEGEYEKVSEIEGMITPDTKVLRLEEPNRMPQHALQSLLPALENRWLETTAGRVELPNLVTTVATMNPTESKQSTFRLSNAMASRFNLGAVMGAPEDIEARRAMLDATDGFEPNPSAIKPRADIAHLDALKDYVLATAEPSDIRERRLELTLRTADAMRKVGIKEADPRFLKHISEVSRALAGLRNGNHTVEEGDVDDAVLLVIAARLGALSTFGSAEIGQIHDSITES